MNTGFSLSIRTSEKIRYLAEVDSALEDLFSRNSKAAVNPETERRFQRSLSSGFYRTENCLQYRRVRWI